MTVPAIVLCPDRYRSGYAKTAHGLVRGSERFEVRAVVDASCAGRDAGVLLDGTPRGIPVVADVAAALAGAGPAIRMAVVGVATHGGRLDAALEPVLAQCIERGLGIANGLHESVADHPRLGPLARRHAVEVIDIRKPPPTSELHFWEGTIATVKAPRIAVLGTDCSVGKRTTARLLTQALGERGLRAEMIYTGQTGWMQGSAYGIVLDCLPNDYVCGELEHVLVRCDRERSPDVMLIEGQSALRNPSGPCGAELLLSAAARGVILQHVPSRQLFEGHEDYGARLPTLAEECALIRMYGSTVIGVALSEEGSDEAAMQQASARHTQELGVPVVRPITGGVGGLVAAVETWIARHA